MSEQTWDGEGLAWDSIIKSWEHGKHNVLQTQNNFNVLQSALANARAKGTQPSKEVWLKIVADESTLGHLELNLKQAPLVVVPVAPPPPVDPKTTIPHQDTFKGVNTLEKAIEYTRVYKTPDAHQIKINELLAYLKLHNIRGKGSFPIPVGVERRDAAKDDAAIKGHTKSTAPVDYSGRMNDLGKDSPIRGRDKSLTDAEKSTAFGQAAALLAGLTKANVGSVGTESNRGTYDAATRLQRFLNRMVTEISKMRTRKVSEEKILEYTKQEIDKLQSSSVR